MQTTSRLPRWGMAPRVPVSTKPRQIPRIGVHMLSPRAVLVPAEINSQNSARMSEKKHTKGPGQSRGLGGALLAAVKVSWERQEQQRAVDDPQKDRVAIIASPDQRPVVSKFSAPPPFLAKPSGNSKHQQATPPQPPPSIESYLREVGVMELRYIRMLSNLCALTYFMGDKLTVASLYRRHRMRLVTSSLVCEVNPRLAQVSALQAMIDGDAGAADMSYVMRTQQHREGENEPGVNPVEPIAGAKSQPLSPSDVVGSSLSAAASSAAAAAAAAASSAADAVVSAAAPITAPLASNISVFTSSATSPIASVAAQLQNAAAAGQASTAATLATVAAAVMTSSNKSNAAAQCLSPMEWFVADDEAGHVRHFVIQGSDTVDHWKVNLTFDPVAFEDKGLGAKVHRGVYETAQLLYDRFLPLVQEHVASTPSARVAFTGHSLGGSLATLLMMMYLRRGVLGPEHLAPVYTFGAPAIFCEGGGGGGCCGAAACGIADSGGDCNAAGGAPAGVLRKLGLPDSAVRNVIMHKDIVPRAFACDYSLVADLLRRVGESFREHPCLSGARRVMFNFVGKVIVLQPAPEATFVGSEGFHAMLPQRPGLFVLREPTVAGRDGSYTPSEVEEVVTALRRVSDGLSNLPQGAAAAMAVPTPSSPSPPAPAAAAPEVASAEEALWRLMNTPHPLDTLGDPGAYGDAGSISRYHNPDNYTRGLGQVLKARGDKGKRLVETAKRNGTSQFQPAALGRVQQPTTAPSGGGKMQSPLAAHPLRRREREPASLKNERKR